MKDNFANVRVAFTPKACSKIMEAIDRFICSHYDEYPPATLKANVVRMVVENSGITYHVIGSYGVQVDRFEAIIYFSFVTHYTMVDDFMLLDRKE